MATTRLSDAVIPEIYESYSVVDSLEKTAFAQSGVAVTNEVISQELNSKGVKAFLPYWKDLDANEEPNYSNDDPEEKAVPKKVGSDTFEVRKAFLNQTYSTMDLVAELAGSNPMQRIKSRFDTYWQRQFQRRLIANCNGILANNIASNDKDMVIDIAVEALASQTDKTRFNPDSFVDALFTLGDMSDQITTIAVHSAVLSRMVKNDDIEYIQDSEGKATIATYKTKRVIVDDGLPVFAGSTNGFKYTSILFGGGAFGYSMNPPKEGLGVEVVRDALAGNGGGMESIIERQNLILHPLGFDNIGTPVKQSFNLAELATAPIWKRKVARKNIPLAFLITN